MESESQRPVFVVKGMAIWLGGQRRVDLCFAAGLSRMNPLERKRAKISCRLTDVPLLRDRPLAMAPREQQEYFRMKRPGSTVQGRRRKLLGTSCFKVVKGHILPSPETERSTVAIDEDSS